MLVHSRVEVSQALQRLPGNALEQPHVCKVRFLFDKVHLQAILSPHRGAVVPISEGTVLCHRLMGTQQACRE
jgi:hypothetical protein